MHNILLRQLNRLNIDPESPPDLQAWKRLLENVDRAYQQADQDHYLLERSLAISSKEMQDLYEAEQQQSEQAIRESEGKYRNLFENAIDSIFVIDIASRQILDVNEIAVQQLGYSREELLGMTIDDLNPASDKADRAQLIQELRHTGSLRFERTHVRKDGSRFPVEVSTSIVEYQGRKIYQSLVRDISKRKKAEEELTHLATHDALTGLANRALFEYRLSQAIEIARRNNEHLAVLFIDLDGFKEINDAFGHRKGDELLKTIAQRLTETVRKSDTVARLGGDEFGILLEGIANEEHVGPTMEKLIQTVAEPFVLRDAQAFITCSIGGSVFPIDGGDAASLIQYADRAMYASKEEGTGNYRLFSAAMKTRALEQLELRSRLREALENQDLSIHYQPQIDARTGRVLGVEALVRWNDPDYGLLLPERFISLAEKTGLIAPLSDWILSAACQQLSVWQSEGLPPVRMAVNLSDRDLKNPQLPEKIEDVLAQTGISPQLLELELSENILFQNRDQTLAMLQSLKAMGVRLAVDDFGTGYSTLDQLAVFPLDTLKIAKKFAPVLTSSESYAAVVQGIALIAQNLGIDIIAEGVETEAQLKFYESNGCHYIQGWYFAKAMPEKDLAGLLREGFKRPQLQLDLKH